MAAEFSQAQEQLAQALELLKKVRGAQHAEPDTRIEGYAKSIELAAKCLRTLRRLGSWTDERGAIERGARSLIVHAGAAIQLLNNVQCTTVPLPIEQPAPPLPVLEDEFERAWENYGRFRPGEGR